MPVFFERMEATSYRWTEGGFGGVIGGRRVFMPSSPGVGSKTTLEPVLLDVPLPGENDGYCLEWNDPHWGVSCRSLKIVGNVKGLIDRA